MKIDFKNKKVLLVICGLVVVLIVIVLLFGTQKVKIKASTNKTMKLINYDHENFTMKIPEGWNVDTAGDNMFFSIRVYDPVDDRYQIFAILKAEPLLKNYKAKNWYESYYKSFGGAGNKLLAKAIVLDKPTVGEFYSNFNNYVNYTKEIGSSFNAPDLKNFAVVETFENNSKLKNIAKDDKILRGTFQDSKTGKTGEGLFMATIVDIGSNNSLGYDVLYYVAYNVMGISTAEYDLVNYQDVLLKSLKSLQYKDAFVSATIKNGEEQTKNALAMNESIQQSYQSYNNAWNDRQKSYDVSSQKYSDATLGYERVYDTKTGEVYKAYNGFTSDYNGSRYEKITDSMYSNTIAGYIEK